MNDPTTINEPPSHLAENIVHFARVLRKAGLPIGAAQIMDALQALQHIGIGARDDFYWALHATLIRRHEHRQIFDQAFHIFWRDPRLIERMMSLMLPELATPPDEHKETSRRLAEALLNSTQDPHAEPENDIDIDARETLSSAEILRSKDFEQMSLAELAEARRHLTQFRLSHETLVTRRSKPSAHGHLVDMRATMRTSLRQGNMLQLKKKTARTRTPSLIILCDISGSMSVYARIFLHFIHALTNDRDRVHTFLFGTRLTNVTRHLRHRDIDEALSAVSKAVEDWDGGTRIGETLHRFNVDWARRVLGQGATVLLITDGLDRDAGEGLEAEITRLHRSSRRLIWLNPLLRYEQFEPKASGIRTILPHVDEFRPVHNLSSLASLVEALSAPLKPFRKAA